MSCVLKHMCLYSPEFGVISVRGWTGCVVLYANVSYMCLSRSQTAVADLKETVRPSTLLRHCRALKSALRAEIMSALCRFLCKMYIHQHKVWLGYRSAVLWCLSHCYETSVLMARLFQTEFLKTFWKTTKSPHAAFLQQPSTSVIWSAPVRA